jgi:hypothetical protein
MAPIIREHFAGVVAMLTDSSLVVVVVPSALQTGSKLPAWIRLQGIPFRIS